MLQTTIKASAVGNLTDARYFAAWEVQWMGFCLDSGSDDYISPNVVKGLMEWVDGPQFVGEFGLATTSEIQEMSELLNLAGVQVDFLSGVDVLMDLEGLVVFKELVLDLDSDPAFLKAFFEQFGPYVNYFVVDFHKNKIQWDNLERDTSMKASDWKSLCNEYPCLFSGDFSETEVRNLMEAIRPAGLCLKGGVEEKVGFKSFEQLDPIFEYLETKEASF